MINNPFRLTAVDFIEGMHEDWRQGLSRPADTRIEVHERHKERFSPAIYQDPPSCWHKAFHRQSLARARVKDSIERVERRQHLEIRTQGDFVASYRATSQRIDRQSFGRTLERLYASRRYLAMQRFGDEPSAISSRDSLLDQLNAERHGVHMAAVIFERNPHGFATDPVLKLAGLPAYSWPQLTAVNLTAVTVKVKA